MNASRTSQPRRARIDSALAVVSGPSQPGRRARTSGLQSRARARLAAELMGVCAQALRQFGVKSAPLHRIPRVRRAVYARRLLIHADHAVTVHTRWQRQADYLDEDGHPRVIPIQGPAPSFEALCRDCGVGHESQQRLLALSCQFELCSRVAGNRLSHIADVLLMRGHPTLMLARAAVTTERFLRTCVHNAKPGRTFSESLGDRTAEVDLSEEEFARLSKAARRFLASFIESADRQLLAGVERDKRTRRPLKARRRSGVTAFVFRD